MNPNVRRIRPDEALALRTLRLRALADAPIAFGSTFAKEEALAESVWHERATHGAAGEDRVTYVAEDGDCWIGMATGLMDERDGFRPELVGMFVEPAERRHGVGVALVEAVTAWARARGGAHLYLWVTSTNAPAIGLYHRCGFRPTGKSKAIEHTPSVSELQMVRDL